jgi:hypothetical protein
MIEIFRKGFRFDINPSQIVTFKKSQNLNGIQDRYAYSNTISMDKTANNKKLLELFDLPTNKVSSLMNGYEVDVVLNGSINLRKQTLKIQKEGLEKVDTYLLFSDNALVVKLKETFINKITEGYLYKKNIADFQSKSIFTETQPKSGLYVIEEMPIVINLQELIKKIFTDNNYSVFGDFFNNTESFKDYYISPNAGKYQIYSGSGNGFAPNFETTLDAFSLLNQVLSLFNCYADIDDTYKTVLINKWTNLSNFKDNYVDYSKFYVNYQDYSFQSKLAKRNEMKYSDSGTTFDSFFANFTSSQEKATYLNSAFGSGSLNLFDDSKILEDGTIETRANGFNGEVSAVRIFKKSVSNITANIYVAGVKNVVSNKKAVPVSMQTIYTDFHKGYTDFILTPLITNIQFRYDNILAANFSLTKVFFIEQLSSYWIPLEINFSTKKDFITIKAMLVKKRKVLSPLLNNFNSIILNFKEKALFPLEYLKSMYPMPPNKYDWDVIIFKRYNENFNKLFVNDVFIPSDSLPQAFSMNDLVSLKVEANKATDTQADFNTDSLYLQAIDTNGGVSNEAYINIKHSGKAVLESNFEQLEDFSYSRSTFDIGGFYVSPVNYKIGLTNENKILVENGAITNGFNLIETSEAYTNVRVEILPFSIYIKNSEGGIGKAESKAKVILHDGTTEHQLYATELWRSGEKTVIVPKLAYNIAVLISNKKIRVYIKYEFNNKRGSNSGNMSVETKISGMKINITTTKSL